MLKAILDSIPKLALAAVSTRVVKIIRIDAGNAPACKADVDVRAPRVDDFPSSVTVLEETGAVAVEPGRYVMVAVFVRLP